jgi:serine/threonine protein kinase
VDELPTVFGYYTLVAKFGRGTTGVVYEALNTALNRRVALKVLPPDAEPAMRARFVREWRVLAHLTSEPGSNIPALHEVGEHQGHLYSAREWVAGSTLEQRVRAGTLDLRAGLAALVEVAGALDWAHQRGFAHRNLSPANVLLATDGASRLIGFGRVGFLAGSPLLPAGATGVLPEIDTQALQQMLGWLCSALRQPVPSALQQQLAAVSSPATFAKVLRAFLARALVETEQEAPDRKPDRPPS